MIDSLIKHIKAVTEKSKNAYIEGRYDLSSEMIKALDELGLPHHCDFNQIKKRYFELCREFHPDRQENISSERFLRIKEAYDVLKSGFQKREEDE